MILLDHRFKKRRKWLIYQIHRLEANIEKDKNYLYSINKQIANAEYSLSYCRDTCQCLRQELQELYEQNNNDVILDDTRFAKYLHDDGVVPMPETAQNKEELKTKL
jgi:hypothetical protein